MDPYFAHEKYDIPRVKGYRVMHGRRGTLPPWALGTDETFPSSRKPCYRFIMFQGMIGYFLLLFCDMSNWTKRPFAVIDSSRVSYEHNINNAGTDVVKHELLNCKSQRIFVK